MNAETNSSPNLDASLLDKDLQRQLNNGAELTHPPKILLLYGSLRERSYSRLVSGTSSSRTSTRSSPWDG